ncbi:MAG: AAA family ATPase [Alphaproteobacteria bacterium]|nr:AAA family ATPase [Alphaproteobacteria bacterium]MBV9861434.1 AAA family ATPase [Alphaproteobacteria bacterium]
MKYLFLDNFRGFREAIIPLIDVNFLVGENSTGKTSLLTMLQMFSGPQILMGSDYSGAESVQFGHFEEMVSAHASDKSYFRLGHFGEAAHRKERRGHGLLLTYENIAGLSQIARVSTTMTGGDVHLRFENKKAFYKIDEVERPRSADEMRQRIPDWIEVHTADRDVNWKQIGSLPEDDDPRRIPLIFLLGLVNSGGEAIKGLSFPVSVAAPHLVWIAPIRTKPRRTYDEPQTSFSPEGSHIPYVIRRMLSSESEATKFKEFIERIGAASGLFQRIEIKYFGSSETSPFEVDAYLDDAAMGIGWLGYGVSQSLPIFVELLDRPAGSWFAIQQPEVHLHPRAQACLGDVFFEMALRDKKKFLIETHSDFTIDRFRLNYRNRASRRTNKNLPSSQILFFQRQNNGNTVTPIQIGRGGELPSEQPEGYRNFFIKEEMKVLGL